MKKPLRLACRAFASTLGVLALVSTAFAQPGTPPPPQTPTPTPVSTTGGTTEPDPKVKEGEQGPPGKSEQRPEQETPPDGFRMGAYTFKPGGRVKLDVIRDLKPIESVDSFDPRTIPIPTVDGTNSNVHAKETRLNLDIRGMADNRELRMFVETDFYGDSSVLRLRHAYGSYGGMLAGQTWSTFMDDDNLPRTIDFEAPMAFAQIRHAQARWTQKLAGFVTWSAAVEDNKSSITTPEDIEGKAEYPMPDLVTRFRFDVPRGHITTSAFVGAARFRPTEGDVDSVTLWGTMVSVKFATWGKDYGYSHFTYGEGIGRYRGGVTAVPDENGKLHPVGGAALMGGYEHFWTDRWSTNGVLSVADTNDQPFFTSDVNKRITYGAVNLLYWFLGDRAWTGVEYLYGRREVFGPGPSDETAHRLQYAVRFNLP